MNNALYTQSWEVTRKDTVTINRKSFEDSISTLKRERDSLQAIAQTPSNTIVDKIKENKAESGIGGTILLVLFIVWVTR